MPSKPPLNLILLGDPGAGKATQAELLSKKYSFLDFDMGRELTLARQRDKEIDLVLKRSTDKGVLAPTKIVRKIYSDRLRKVSSKQGIVFDGTPKMLGEAKLLTSLLKALKRPNPLVIYIKIPETEVVKRVLGRKGYENTKYSQRSDDNLQALKNRAKYYKKNIKQVTSYFDKLYKFYCIDGMGTKTEVNRKIHKIIKEYTKDSEKWENIQKPQKKLK